MLLKPAHHSRTIAFAHSLQSDRQISPSLLFLPKIRNTKWTLQSVPYHIQGTALSDTPQNLLYHYAIILHMKTLLLKENSTDMVCLPMKTLYYLFFTAAVIHLPLLCIGCLDRIKNLKEFGSGRNNASSHDAAISVYTTVCFGIPRKCL